MEKNIFKRILYQSKILTLALVLFSCQSSSDSPVEPESFSRGDLVRSTWLGKFNSNGIETSIAGYELNIDLVYDVEVYQIIYRTSDPKGNIIEASGALFVPVGKNNLSLMSIQHGTETKRTNVGSKNIQKSFEGLVGAGLGYFTLVPDYLGLGESQMVHPYHYAKTSAETVIDFIKACRKEADKLNVKLNGQAFLAGYSEGGYVTMAAHREIQQKYSNEIIVTASAPMAGAYNLYQSAKTIFVNKIYDEPSFLAYLIVAYNNIYGWNKINSIFNSPYAEKIPSLFDGSKTTNEINSALQNDLTKLFKQDFLNSFIAGTETDFTNALKENGLLDWIPTAPVKLFHGDADPFVPYQNSTEARDYFLSHGAANIELATIPGGNHYTSAIPSIIGAIQWFEALRLKKAIAAN